MQMPWAPVVPAKAGTQPPSLVPVHPCVMAGKFVCWSERLFSGHEVRRLLVLGDETET